MKIEDLKICDLIIVRTVHDSYVGWVCKIWEDTFFISQSKSLLDHLHFNHDEVLEVKKIEVNNG